MDYKKIYDLLIARRQLNAPTDSYTEVHHILPKAVGGSDEPSNLVRLSGREHYVAHLLLAKIDPCRKNIFALWMMQCSSRCHPVGRHISKSRMYAWAREKFSEYSKTIDRTGMRNSQFGSKWITNIELKKNAKIPLDAPIPEGWMLGRNGWNKRVSPPMSRTEIGKLGAAATKKKGLSAEGIDNIRSIRLGKPRTDEVKKKISEGLKRNRYNNFGQVA